MSDLTLIEKRHLEKAFGMESGYVLNFSNRTFSEFILDSIGLDIWESKYDYASGSKANRLREFWKVESNFRVEKLLSDIFEAWEDLNNDGTVSQPPENCLKILQRLKNSSPVPEIGVVTPNSNEESFENLAKSVREAIDKNEPEAGLDRLHTFLVKYFRVLCGKHGIDVVREKPLHSLVGQYVKALGAKNLIESEMTERILKSTISIMEAFNKVRNDQSLAHANKVLNYEESLLIFGHVTSSIRFIQSLESRQYTISKPDVSENTEILF